MSDKPVSFGPLPDDEVLRRQKLSKDAKVHLDMIAFQVWYQERCDKFYWDNGPCCAGCDHWESGGGNIGECKASAIVSSAESLSFLGITCCSRDFGAGHALTRHDYKCGLFKDDFDWSELGAEYLKLIGAKI